LGIAALLLAAAGPTVHFWQDWHYLGPLPPSGGFYFPKRIALAVPIFRQNDPRWGADLLGPTDGTLGAEGCALSSAAMIMAYYGLDTDPQRLNQFLNQHEGYTPQGWIYWEKAADLDAQHVRKAYEDLPSYCLIDCNLLRGNPVIVHLTLPHGSSHFVVIAGKEGYDYLIRDPGAGADRGLYPLKDLGSKIYGLRFYDHTR
jgi:Peptidase C39 family